MVGSLIYPSPSTVQVRPDRRRKLLLLYAGLTWNHGVPDGLGWYAFGWWGSKTTIILENRSGTCYGNYDTKVRRLCQTWTVWYHLWCQYSWNGMPTRHGDYLSQPSIQQYRQELWISQRGADTNVESSESRCGGPRRSSRATLDHSPLDLFDCMTMIEVAHWSIRGPWSKIEASESKDEGFVGNT